MNRSRFTAIKDGINSKRNDLMIDKSADYADDDVLANFKRISLLAKLLDIDVRRSPGDYARFMVLMKLDRWCNLKSKGVSPKCESVKDTVCDKLNYTDLAYACDVEDA